MNRVLLVAAGKQAVADLRPAVAPLRALDARIALAVYPPIGDVVASVGLDEVHSLSSAGRAHGPAFRRSLHGADLSTKVWRHLRRDAWLLERVRTAAVVVAMDEPARLAIERLAPRRVTVVHDLVAAAELLAQGVADPPPRRDRARRRLRRWAGSTAAHVLLRCPGVPERRRYTAARRIGLDLLGAGRDERADRLVLRTLPRLTSVRRRADLLGDVVSAALAAGRQPALARAAYAAELEVADRHLAQGRPRQAAESFEEATRTAFHRVLHFDHLWSPLADDPVRYTAPLRSSAVARELAAPRGRTAAPAVDDANERPRTRVLLATRRNDDFLGEIRTLLENHPDFDARFVDFVDDQDLNRAVRSLPAKILCEDTAALQAAERAFRQHLDEVDVVFVEWCTALAALMTLVDPGDTRVVVRMHAYEAFTPWPHLMDFSRVDDVIFVSPHLRDLAVNTIPALSRPDGPRLHVVTNAMDLRACRRPKPDEARFTLALLGASKVVKDPRWAIDVLRRLRRHDERYRLLLIGGRFQHEHNAATRTYAAGLSADLAELEPSGAVLRLPYTDDVPAALEDVGVIVSSSVRESFHIGLVEGAASGAVPVVRDWPYFPGAARDLFPPEWVVQTPGEAAERILATTTDVDTWRSLGTETAALVTDRWDWQVVQHAFVQLLGARARLPGV